MGSFRIASACDAIIFFYILSSLRFVMDVVISVFFSTFLSLRIHVGMIHGGIFTAESGKRFCKEGCFFTIFFAGSSQIRIVRSG